MATTDGESIWAFRYSSEGKSRSLYYSTNVATASAPPEVEILHGLGEETRLVVSEPLGDLPGAWNEVPESAAGVVRPGTDEMLLPAYRALRDYGYMRVHLPLAVVVALVAVLVLGCGGRKRRLRRRVRRTAAVRQRALPSPRAAGKPSCRREAEAFRPLLARRTARRGNRAVSSSR